MTTTPATTLRLRWQKPATGFTEGIPIGNGRIGAMLHGDATAVMELNDSTGWSGTPDRPATELLQLTQDGAGPALLAQLRRAIDADRADEARRLAEALQGSYSQEFLPLARLSVRLSGQQTPQFLGRELDLDEAVAEERLRIGNTVVRRSSWASAPSGVLVAHYRSEGGAFDANVGVATSLKVVRAQTSAAGMVLETEFPIDGAPAHEPDLPSHTYRKHDDGWDPYAVIVVRVDTDGQVNVQHGDIRIVGASTATIVVATHTRARLWWDDPHSTPTRVPRDRIRQSALSCADRALARGAGALLDEHLADVRDALGGSAVRIGGRRAGVWDVDTEVFGADEALRATVLHAWGRYLLLSSSRNGNPAANLQGIWNAAMSPAWSSNYTLNINTQMNYWLADVTGLQACVEPLVGLVERIAVHGEAAARELYGARGWVAHHNSDLWGWALPVGRGKSDPSWAVWMMGGVWLVHNLLDHLDFVPDSPLRQRIAPLVRGAVEFVLDWLVPSPNGPTLRTIPSTSPENHFIDAQGRERALTQSVTMDIALISALLSRAQNAAGCLDTELTDRAREAAAGLPGLRVRPDGVLAEWPDHHVDADPHHRHLSPAVGLFPLSLVVDDHDPLWEAHLRLLDERGPGAMGWSWAWKILLRARLGDAQAARDLFLEASRRLERDPDVAAPVDGAENGGLLPNLLSTHPPFQIDGNFGLTAALTEMLVQSHAGRISVLPALPHQWREGSARGVRLRGGMNADITWSGGCLVSVVLHEPSEHDQTVAVEYRGRSIKTRVPARGSTTLLLQDWTDGPPSEPA